MASDVLMSGKKQKLLDQLHKHSLTIGQIYANASKSRFAN